MGRLAFVLGTVFLCANVSGAATLRVPEDYRTVLMAVDLAMPGDTVQVGPGTWSDTDTRVIIADNGVHYYTACAYARGGIVIQGAGAGVTILDVGGPAPTFGADVVFVQRWGEGVLTLESMTLTGVDVGSAVTGLFSDGLEIRSCRFEENVNAAGAGAAVTASECPLTMTDCELYENKSFGVVRLFYNAAELSGCRFEQNVGRCVDVYSDQEYYPVSIQDCEFVRNRGDNHVCVNMQTNPSYVIEGCLFQENVAETGSGAAVRTSGSTGQIRFCVFAFDSCYGSSQRGGGIRWEASTGACLDNTFVGCSSGHGGSAFSADQGTVTAFRGNVVAKSSGAVAVNASSTTTVLDTGCNLFWENAAGDYGNWTPDSTDVFADPLFCDLQNLDFTVQEGSPCLDPPTPSCAPIGALGLGCTPVAVEEPTPLSFGRIKAMYR